MPTVLITGTSRGLGLELVRQYADEGWRVHACCRRPEASAELRRITERVRGAVEVHALDVADFERIDALAARLRGVTIDVLVNSAGLFGPKFGAEKDPRQTFGRMDYEIWSAVLRVNTMAPLKMSEAFIEHVAASEQKKIASLTSSMGSIAETSGSYYAYRSSKAALNMVMASLARDLARRGIAVGIFCPGWVRTDMGGPGAPVTPEDSIRGLRQRIAELSLERSGRWLRYDGREVSW